MFEVKGIMLPDHESHLVPFIDGSVLVDGKGTYQLEKYERALQYVRPTRGAAIDVGAHVGLWTRLMARDFSAVVAFEPVPEHFACLRVNADLKSNPHVALVPAAVGMAAGVASIETLDGNSGHTQVRQPHEKPGAHKILIVALDKALPEDFAAPIDLLKIDVEGMELDVIMGGEALIRSHRPVVVVEQKAGNAEHFGRTRWAARDLLRSWGYEEKTVLHGDHIMVWPDE